MCMDKPSGRKSVCHYDKVCTDLLGKINTEVSIFLFFHNF